MMTVKDLREMLKNANDDDVVFFMTAYEDRDGYTSLIKARGIKGITTEAVTEERKAELKYYGY